jgi:phosphoribosyl-dephospho-CoA transferase
MTATYAEIEKDLRERFTPTQDEIVRGAEYARRTGEEAYVAIALPNKDRGIWTLGQRVVNLGVVASRDAAVARANSWLRRFAVPGSVAYAVVDAEGSWAVFEW